MNHRFAFILLIALPANAHACIIVPSAWVRLGYPAAYMALSLLLLLFSFRMLLTLRSPLGKIAVAIVCALLAYPIYEIYSNFNYSGAADCGSQFSYATLQFMVYAILISLVAPGIRKFAARSNIEK